MKIFFDVSSLLYKTLTTDGVYTKNLYRLLRGLGADISPVYNPPSGVKDNYIEYHTGHSAKKVYGFLVSRGTLLHGPSGNLLSESDKFKKIISVNDMSMYREGFHSKGVAQQLQDHLKQQVQNDLQAVIVPTYEIHTEFLVRFPKLVNRVHVISPGSDHIFDSSNLGDNRIDENPYFLFNGVIDRQSNILGVLKAFDAFCNINKNVRLVIAGANGYGSDAIHKEINKMGNKDFVKIVGTKSDAQMKKIYSDAIALIVPSFYEGFSFPLAEAMRMGCPVVTSGLGSMKEVGGEAVHLVNPKDPEQIMAGMERMYADKVYREKLRGLGVEATKSMTWLNCAKAIFKIYQSIG